MKIYTRKGDEGKTSLLGGTRVPKHHGRIEAYGSVDELNSHIGLLRDSEKNDVVRLLLLHVQECLFVIGAMLACDPEKSKLKVPEISDDDVKILEQDIDRMNETLPEMRFFVLPGGHPDVSFCHVARCVCRRAERKVVQLAEQSPVPPVIIRYLNRLSDHLFVLARARASGLGVEEIPWKGRGK